jgi:ribosomal protein L32
MIAVVYPALCLVSGVIGGLIGQRKGSSYLVWFLVSAIVPLLGPLAALLYRHETDVAMRRCPGCGSASRIHDALCMRCGSELDYPRPEEIIEPDSRIQVRARL